MMSQLQWLSPLPSVTLVSCTPTTRTSRGTSTRDTPFTRLRGPSFRCGMGFQLHVADPRDLCASLADTRRSRCRQLSLPTTSLGVVQRFSPPSSRPRWSPLPERAPGCPATHTFGRGVPPPRHVPSSWFCATSTACSSRAARTCCSPLPTLGFTPFPAIVPSPSPGCVPALRSLPSPCSDPDEVQVGDGHPPRRCRPFGSPAPLPSHGCRFTPRLVLADDARLRGTRMGSCLLNPPPGRPASGPCSTRGSVASHAVARAPGPLLPWA
jgi:hypothetical protein